MGEKHFYAVQHPFKAIYSNWNDCERDVRGVSRARYKGFGTREEARAFMLEDGAWDNQRATTSSSGGGGYGGGGHSGKRKYEEAARGYQRQQRQRAIEVGSDSDGSDVVVLEPPRKRRSSSSASSSSASSSSAFSSSSSSSSHDRDDEATTLTQALPASTQSQRQSQSLYADEYPAHRATAAPASATLYFDGGARGNPGVAGSGAVLYDDSTGQPIWTGSQFVGRSETNNVAEYRGLLLGLEAAKERGVKRLQVKGDSKLVINQVTGRWKCEKPHLQVLHKKASKLAGGFERCRLEYVPREANRVADRLANEAMDRMR